MKLHPSILRTILVFIFSYCMYSCAVNPVTGKKEISLMSEAQEINMGKNADPSIVAAFGLYDNPEIQAFINEKGQENYKRGHEKDTTDLLPSFRMTCRVSREKGALPSKA